MTDSSQTDKSPLYGSTLVIDLGGTFFKAGLVANDEITAQLPPWPTPYPVTPQALVDTIGRIAAELPGYARVAIGFPGVVRDGRVRYIHAFTRPAPGLAATEELETAWTDLALHHLVRTALGVPVFVANDADMMGAALIHGHGMELVLTLGTGVGNALYYDGVLLPHLEISHGPFENGADFNTALSNLELQRIGTTQWNNRLSRALDRLGDMLLFDHCYLTGGNSRFVHLPQRDDVSIAEPVAAILGGARLWYRQAQSGPQ
ncbi:ROK family protein [Streptomyces sp. NPDC001083]|uniref:ROK family protein n=1 Tax=Streptomyces sp. NPDC001083 TaxID=3364545 RepID=UPI003689ACE1